MPPRRRGTNTVSGVVRAKSQKVVGVTGFVRTKACTVRLRMKNPRDGCAGVGEGVFEDVVV